MTRTSLTIFLAVSMAATVGCTSKNYVKQQTTPLINKTNELDDLTAKNTRDIKDVDARAQAGIRPGKPKTREGGRDSVGSADYNYDLSPRRANSVIQYLAMKYNVPAHKIYVIGLGKDKPVDSNKTSQGRADNRRVDVRLMSNTQGDNAQPAAASTSGNPSSM